LVRCFVAQRLTDRCACAIDYLVIRAQDFFWAQQIATSMHLLATLSTKSVAWISQRPDSRFHSWKLIFTGTLAMQPAWRIS
jgi:hypothetical protein